MRGRALIVDGDPSVQETLELWLSGRGYEIARASDALQAHAHLTRTPFDVIFCDTALAGEDGSALGSELVRRFPDSTLIALSSRTEESGAAQHARSRPYDSLDRPLERSALDSALARAEDRQALRHKVRLLEREMSRAAGDCPIVAASAAMIELLEATERVADYRVGVLIGGERGSGREVLARAVHAQSPRRGGPFASAMCAGVPEARLHAMLFGHAAGAAPGDDRARDGLFLAADGGTLLLEEVGALPSALQVELLRVLLHEEVRPTGAAKARAVDVRVIASTSQDLASRVAEGEFNRELLDRLCAARLDMPPLRARAEDIPLLVDHFFARACEATGKQLRAISDEALERLVAYPWPGNVRELQNVIERAVMLADGDVVVLSHIPENVASPPRAVDRERSRDLGLRRARKQLEGELIRRALRTTGGNRTHAARLLEISHRALLYKIKEHAIGD
jgi:two-component system response regulator AtoC